MSDWPLVTGEGRHDAFDPSDLQDVRHRIVDPVLQALIHPEDEGRLEVRVGWGPQDPGLGYVSAPGEGDVWVYVRLDQAAWSYALGSHRAAGEPSTIEEVVSWLADEMSDWTCESVYWGEKPTGAISIPSDGDPSFGSASPGRPTLRREEGQ